jgi:hypothetical protein
MTKSKVGGRRTNAQKAIEKYENRPKNIWERFDNETEVAFRAFNMYLSLGIGNRSLVKVREKLGKTEGYTSQLEEWSSQHSWVVRCQAYDSTLIDATLKSSEQERMHMYQEAAKQANAIRNIGAGTLAVRYQENPDQFTIPQLQHMFEMGLKAELLTREGLLATVNESTDKLEIEVQMKTTIFDLVKDDPEAKHHLTAIINKLTSHRRSISKPSLPDGNSEQ